MAMTIRPFLACLHAAIAILLLLTVATPAMARQGSAAATLAITDPRGTVPGVFDVIADPGGTATIPLQFEAEGDTAIEATSWIANVTSAVNGGVAISAPDAVLEQPATWLSMQTGAVAIEPGEPVTRSVTIRVPAGAEPGVHVAAIVVQGVEPVPIPGSDAVQVIRSTALIAMQVPGEIDAGFELDAPTLVQHGRGNVVQVGVRNTGTVPVSPAGRLTLRDASGETVSEAEVDMGAVFAGTSTVLEAPLSPLPPVGTYSLDLDLTDADTGATARIANASIVIPEGLEATLPTVPAATDAPATPQPGQQDAPAVEDIQFEDASVRAEGDPLFSVFVEASIVNTGSPIQPARLVLVASRNGQVVEEAIVADRMALATGVTSISTRYAPQDGFEGGIWTFSLRLETVGDDGAATVLAQTGTVAKIDLS